MYRSKSFPCCQQCSRKFYIKYSVTDKPKKKFRSGHPYLLNCGHSYCEECVYNTARAMSFIHCSVCQVDTQLPEGGGEQAIAKLSRDNYTAGVLVNGTPVSLTSYEPRMIPAGHSLSFSKPRFSSTSSLTSTSSTSSAYCEECSISPAMYSCRQCILKLCRPCFKLVHNNSKTLSSHEALPILEDSEYQLPLACDEHKLPLEFYCIDHDCYVCSHCLIIGSHKHHHNVTIKEKNKEYVDECKTAAKKARNVLTRLKKAEKHLGSYIHHPQTNEHEISNTIRTFFQHIHGLLQIRENKLLNELEDLLKNNSSSTEKLKLEVSESINSVNAVLQDAEKAAINSELFDMNKLLNKLKDIPAMPSFIMPVEIAENEECLRFEPDAEIANALNQCGKIVGLPRTKFKFVNEAELPPDFVIEPEEQEKEILTRDSSSSTCSLSQESDSVGEPVVYPIPLKTRNRSVHLLKHELVYVTHIISPAMFMVQKYSQIDNLRKLSAAIAEWFAKTPNNDFETVFQKEDIVLAQYSSDNNWYRARVLQVTEETKDFSTDDNSGTMVEVGYLDYGNSEILPLSKIRQMPPKFLNYQEAMLKCSLHDITPVNKEWSSEAIEMFQVFVGGYKKPIQMVVYENVGGILQVDLHRTPLHNHIMNDTPVSVREALIFSNFAYYLHPSATSNEAMSIQFPSQQSYFNPTLPKHCESLEVTACFVNNPDHFFVQQMGENGTYMTNLMFQLQDTYNKVEDANLWTIFCPRLNMPCVAKYSQDQQWYRARIESFPAGNKVKVYYVDYGNEEVLHWDAIKKICDKFLKLPMQAIRCSLVDVAPIDESAGWPESFQSFSELLQGKNLKINVKDQTNDNLSVILYEIKEDRYMCINTLLADKGYAKSTGPNSTILSFPKELPDVVKLNQPNHSLRDVSESNAFAASIAAVADPIILKRAGQPDMLSVKIVHINSPACFYCQCLGGSQDALEGIMTDMQKTYNNSIYKPRVWKEKDIVAIKLEEKAQWFRAQIESVEEKSIKGFCVDYGFRVEVNAEKVRNLHKRHYTSHFYAICCSLADIQPAGGTSKWTNTAVEHLKDIAEKHSLLFMTKKDSSQKKCLPVDLYYKLHVPGTALEPDIITYESVVNTMVEHGVALRLREKLPTCQKIAGDFLPKMECPIIASKDRLMAAIEKHSQVDGDCVPNEAFETEKSIQTPSSECLLRRKEKAVKPEKTENSRCNPSVELLMNGNTKAGKHAENDFSATVPVKNQQAISPSGSSEKQTFGNCKEENDLPLSLQMNLKSFLSESDEDDNSSSSSTDMVHVDSSKALINVEEKLPILTPPVSEGIRRSRFALSNEISGSALPQIQASSLSWKKPDMPKETVFDAIVTYVDYDGCLYLYDTNNQAGQIMLKATLNREYQNTEPDSHDLYWLKDQPCIAQYAVDNNWYRAQVKNVTEEGVKVIFIDYGNTETIKHSKLRKKLTCAQFPRQVLRCTLHGIQPISEDGKWPIEVLDFLHKEIVELEFQVTLKAPPVKEPLQVSLYCKLKKTTLEEWLMSIDIAMKMDVPRFSNIDYCIHDAEELESNIPFYKPCSLPNETEKFAVTLINFEFPSLLWMQRKPCENPQSKYEREVVKDSKELTRLFTLMNHQAPKWQKIESPKIGDAVCCQFDVDKLWYRASVQKLLPKGCEVIYVDFGNKARNFLDLPMQATYCQLHQVVPSNGQWSIEIHQNFNFLLKRLDHIITL